MPAAINIKETQMQHRSWKLIISPLCYMQFLYYHYHGANAQPSAPSLTVIKHCGCIHIYFNSRVAYYGLFFTDQVFCFSPEIWQHRFLDAEVNFCKWQWSKVFPTPCGYFHHGNMTGSHAMSREGSNITHIQQCFCPWPLCPRIYPESLNLFTMLIYCLRWKT